MDNLTRISQVLQSAFYRPLGNGQDIRKFINRNIRIGLEVSLQLN